MRRRQKKSACKICISCNEPNEDGKMHVEMTYEGDEILAAYLLENAQSILGGQLSPSSEVTSIGN
ncbi:MAG: hypothetical protein K1000chlam2_01624 [Chlamydiae bacterium]|nr:hypothetical protein [Chlamydiota bacterium]